MSGQAVFQCSNCDGLWLPEDRLSLLLQNSPEQLEHSALADSLHPNHPEIPLQLEVRCPVCQAGMERHIYAADSGVVVDSCWDHGVWLDDGELASIFKYAHKFDDIEEALRKVPQSPHGRGLFGNLAAWWRGYRQSPRRTKPDQKNG